MRCMTDQKPRPRPAAQYGPTGQQVKDRVRKLREARGLTIYDLAGRLRDIGRPIAASAVAKIERGQRQVTADDLMALALALNTSPITLLLPPDSGDTSVQLTESREIQAQTAWRWIRGLAPANDWGTGTDAEWHDDEWHDKAERDYRTAKEEYDAVTLPPELRRVRQHPASRDADLVELHVARLVRLSPRVSDETFEDQLAQTRTALARLSTELDRMAEERALRARQEGGTG